MKFSNRPMNIKARFRRLSKISSRRDRSRKPFRASEKIKLLRPKIKRRRRSSQQPDARQKDHYFRFHVEHLAHVVSCPVLTNPKRKRGRSSHPPAPISTCEKDTTGFRPLPPATSKRSEMGRDYCPQPEHLAPSTSAAHSDTRQLASGITTTATTGGMASPPSATETQLCDRSSNRYDPRRKVGIQERRVVLR